MPLFVEGQPGLPGGGRPKGLALRIRELTDNLREELQYVHDLASGKLKASHRDRMDAVRYLTERGYGKAIEIQAVGSLSDEQRATAQELTREQLLALVAMPTLPLSPGVTGPQTGPVDGEVVEVVRDDH